MVWGFAAMLASLLPAPLRRIAARVLRMPLLEDPRVLRLGLRGALNHRSRLLPPGPFTDEELRSIQQPSLVFVGEKSEVFPSRDVRSRLEALLPHAAVELVHRGGHAVAVSHLEHISDRLVSFLAAQDAASPR